MTHADWLISGPEKVILPSQKVYEKSQAILSRTDLALG